MRKKLISLLALMLSVLLLMPSAVFAVETLAEGSAEYEIGSLIGDVVIQEIVDTEDPEITGPANATYVEGPVPDAGISEGVFLENIPVDERQSVCIDELMAVARVRLTEMIVNDEIAVMDEDIADADSELTAVADANYMAFALQQLRLMDLDETGMSPKYAVVFGTLTVTGWSKENGYWYYYDENGSKVYGWLNLIESGTSYWYYLDPTNSGRMVTGRKTLYTGTEARLYYFTANGPMAHGWYRLDLYNTGDNYYYYFGVPGNPDTGYMRKGWLEDQDGKWYYLSTDDGHMLAGILFTDSNNDLYYLAADGHMVTEQWYSNYYFKSSGIAARSEFLTVGSNRYYFGDNRRTVKGWFVINSKTYHADPTTGIMTRGTSYLGSPYVRSTFNSTTGEWMSDTLITKTASDHGYPYNLRWKYLQVANGKRGPVLKVNYDGVSQQYRPYLEQAIDAYNNDPDLFVTIEVVAESAANLRICSRLSTNDINENAGFTRCYDSQGNEFCPEYVTGEIASSDIYIYELYIDTQHLKGLFMHEIGHVLGLRHTYEPSNGQTDPGTVALMHPGSGHINARDSFQDYDYQQYQYTYPE
ncbi:MAG: hypothetical protein PUC47_06350 [Oscillospiraceae bacterium]|nr:hypothetical protein [Oscillospiraceae bacterium]